MSNFDVLPPLLGEDLRELVDVSCGIRQRSKLKPSTKENQIFVERSSTDISVSKKILKYSFLRTLYLDHNKV